MEQFKKAKVILLPTENKSIIALTGEKLVKISESNYGFSHIKSQHLYIISDDEIKEGDWYIYLKYNTIIQKKDSLPLKNNCKKIIATTDNSLMITVSVPHIGGQPNRKMLDVIKLPQPSQQFIQKYVEEYNKGNVITDVLVEYETLGKYGNVLLAKSPLNNEFNSDMSIYSDYLKINPKDNTITIKKLKDSWNKEEVINLLLKAMNYSYNGLPGNLTPIEGMNKWIEENL